MPKTEKNVKKSEDFIRKLMMESFRQELDPETLRSAAEKLCEALPKVSEAA